MHDPEKSDSGIVATKPTNKARRPAAELVEPRPGTKGNADQQSTHRAQSRARVTQALDRVRKAARQRKKEQFTSIGRVINLINPMLRGWVNYFAVGHSSECFSFVKDWVEKKVRRQLAHAQKRRGFGWERWSRRWLYDTLGLFNAYRVRRDRPKVALAG